MPPIKQALVHELQELTLADVHAELRQHPELAYESLFSLLSHHTTRNVKKKIPAARSYHGVLTPDLINAFVSGKPLAAIATDEGLPPSSLVRLMMPGLVKRGILVPQPDHAKLKPKDLKLKDLVLNPLLICDEWREHILAAIDEDSLCSPASDEVARLVGLEYEHILQRKLHVHGIPYKTEVQLKTSGASKTPDVELQIPIEVDGRVVNWIDSKAMFADRPTYNEHRKQCRSYVNRFGPGMVIYWFGHVDSLPHDDDVVIAEGFPQHVCAADPPLGDVGQGTLIPVSRRDVHRFLTVPRVS